MEEKPVANGRVKSQSEGVVMGMAMDNVLGDQTVAQFVGATFHLDPESSSSIDALSADVDGMGDDPVETYFACITTCSLDDGDCITVCTEQLRESH
ncbi:hypothetical protein [Synechococcus sp. CS-1332]|uniref:hypothetical protein n=1 Tax=Synechococcus sp. CS-1332 TaxID=2847972 RepID=UPI00223BADA7|nr:hypothetical protein [Synechococcus sp. CS-1332]MCT0207663.1 hypothetical protein [Synechococcus sp. CS-1332]